ncbi:MAG: hypothetical protein Q7K41_02680, partial [Dehalococcoidales bacterium]|nr:hypothetical protein [Dehalococcoidales bacterium]
YGDKIADLIDSEVYSIIQEAHALAKKLLTENKATLILIAEKLIAQETLEGKDLEAVFTNTVPPAAPEVTATTTPIPVEPVAEVEAEPQAKPKRQKAPAIPQLLPKQTPAPSD